MYKNFLLFILVIATFPAVSVTAGEKTIIIHAGTLLSVPGESPNEKQSIVINAGSIVDIRNGFITIADAEVIDLSNAFVIPGMIDTHTHLQFGGANYLQDLLTQEDSLVTLRAYSEANKSLRAGFTTIRDMGGDPDVIFGLRDAINLGYVDGPKIIAAGPVIVPTGGGIIRGFRRDIMEVVRDTNLEYPCDGADSCRQAVRQLVKDGADFIKIVASSSILAPGGRGLEQQMTVDEIAAIVDTAHKLGTQVSAHAHGLTGINVALNAGVDSIEHGTFGDKTSIKLYQKYGAYLVPTLSSMTSLDRLAKKGESFSPEVTANVIAANDYLFRMLNLAYKDGVKIAFGTDVNVGMHGGNAGEFLLLKKAGMSEMDMIQAATVVASELLGLSKQIGTIESGKIADIVATYGNPLENIDKLLNISFVMKSGKIIKNQMQVNADSIQISN